MPLKVAPQNIEAEKHHTATLISASQVLTSLGETFWNAKRSNMFFFVFVFFCYCVLKYAFSPKMLHRGKRFHEHEIRNDYPAGMRVCS